MSSAGTRGTTRRKWLDIARLPRAYVQHEPRIGARQRHHRGMAAPAPVAAKLRIEPDARVTMPERLGLVNRVPISLTRAYHDQIRHPALIDALRTSPTITAALLAVGVMDHRRPRTRVIARSGSAPT